jgi:hypothetical protein
MRLGYLNFGDAITKNGIIQTENGLARMERSLAAWREQLHAGNCISPRSMQH